MPVEQISKSKLREGGREKIYQMVKTGLLFCKSENRESRREIVDVLRKPFTY